MLLALIGVCQLVLTVGFLWLAKDLRRLFAETRKILIPARKTARRVERVLAETCQALSDTVRQFLFLKGKAQAFLAERLGNGEGGSKVTSSINRRKHG